MIAIFIFSYLDKRFFAEKGEALLKLYMMLIARASAGMVNRPYEKREDTQAAKKAAQRKQNNLRMIHLIAQSGLVYVPTYQVVERIRKEEKKIAKDKINSANNIAKTAKANEEKVLMSAISFLYEKQMSSTKIAKILDVSTRDVVNIINKIKGN